MISNSIFFFKLRFICGEAGKSLCLEKNQKWNDTDYDIPKLIKVFLNKKQHSDTPIGLCQMKFKE